MVTVLSGGISTELFPPDLFRGLPTETILRAPVGPGIRFAQPEKMREATQKIVACNAAGSQQGLPRYGT